MKVYTSLITIAGLGANLVDGHGYVSSPLATFVNNHIDTSFITTVDASIDPSFAGLKFDGSPENNQANFAQAFTGCKYDSLRALIDSVVPGCGHTVDTSMPVDVSGMSTMTWQNDQERTGFITSHSGPCEVWIDDTRVAQNDDCRTAYAGFPATIPVDYSVCSGQCELKFYWLALHEANWQVYKNCVPIVNGNGDHAAQDDAMDFETTTDNTPSPEETTPVMEPTHANCQPKRRLKANTHEA